MDGLVPEQRIVEAAAVLPEVGGVTGWGALRWMGGIWFDGLTPGGRDLLDVDLATCYQDIRSQPGYRVWQERLGPEEVARVDGIAVTPPARSLFFAMRYAPSERESVVVADMAAYSDLCSIEEILAYALQHPGWTGVPRVRRALARVDENSWSPWETRLRLVWIIDAGLPPPLCNRPVFDRQGRHIGTPDLLDVEAGVYGEYDGSVHLAGAQRSRDMRRDERLRDHGLEAFHVFSNDMADREEVARRMHAARRRARWEAESRRTWTIEPPAWWKATHTVELRRALGDETRERLLRRRRAS